MAAMAADGADFTGAGRRRLDAGCAPGTGASGGVRVSPAAAAAASAVLSPRAGWMRAGLVAGALVCLAGQGQAVTLLNNVTITPVTPFDPQREYEVGYHGFLEAKLTPVTDSSWRFRFHGIAEEFAFYRANPGDLIDQGYVDLMPRMMSNTNNPGETTVSLGINECVYWGYWAGSIDYYGWVKVCRTPQGLVAAESATSVGNGIRVGEFVEVPEPSVPLLGLSALGLGLRRRRVAAAGGAVC